jgi:hypothetical protein
MSTTFDCCACGACCCLGFDVLLTEPEAETFEADPRLAKLTWLYRSSGGLTARFLRKSEPTGHCIALAGQLGGVHCTIYSERPNLCRVFEVGSPDCLEARAKMGLGP